MASLLPLIVYFGSANFDYIDIGLNLVCSIQRGLW